ncbi:putative aliphatic sulfonates transport permease protein SsuC [Calidithermus terrae]|uniref:Putative aliphatic sulfonates transport permease protein SsuC n=1 Tax=Calidithermus terrae TaxID=1408545 RepID=A0A399EXR9_9DEIN|nr:ABC transporter permease subunit [Calidithermus terrae]RIH89397.1 putative aliphatic sulfonates transport permease protein SsuC [Calidithermus terrae]
MEALPARAQPRATGELSRSLGLRLLSLLSIVLVWLLLSWLMGRTVVPGPLETVAFLAREHERGQLWLHIGITLWRVMVAFAITMALGVLIGVAVGASRTLDRLLEAWVVTGLAVPRILPLVVCYLLIGLNDTAAIVGLVIILVPQVVVQMREGIRAIDVKLVEMARALRRPRGQIWRQVVLPQLAPYLLGTARGALSLSWKMVVFAELLGRTSGVGYQINFYFQMFEMRGILAYGLAMTLVLAAVDLTMLALGERAFRWRRPVERVV